MDFERKIHRTFITSWYIYNLTWDDKGSTSAGDAGVDMRISHPFLAIVTWKMMSNQFIWAIWALVFRQKLQYIYIYIYDIYVSNSRKNSFQQFAPSLKTVVREPNNTVRRCGIQTFNVKKLLCSCSYTN